MLVSTLIYQRPIQWICTVSLQNIEDGSFLLATTLGRINDSLTVADYLVSSCSRTSISAHLLLFFEYMSSVMISPFVIYIVDKLNGQALKNL